MSEHRLRVKTVLPAPMRVILGTSSSLSFEASTDVTCPAGQDQAVPVLLMDARVLGAAGTAIGALLDPDFLPVHREDGTVPVGDAL